MTVDDRDLAEGLVDALSDLLTTGCGGIHFDWGSAERRDCAALFRTLYGHDLGHQWEPVLAGLLREHEQARIHERMGGDTTWPQMRAPSEILAILKERAQGEFLPSYLTEDVIERVFDMVNLGGRGGRGKKGARTPEECVAWFVATASTTEPRKP